MRNLKIASGVLVLLIVFFLQLFFSARRNSITWDEDDHIFAGYMSWKHADFGLNPEHPPLVKLVATLPLLNMPLKVPTLQNRFFKTEAFLDGKDFLFKNDANAILFRVRMAASFFTFALLLLVFLATSEMFGTVAAFIALALLAFDPNLLAHGAVLGTDVGLCCCMFASIYAFYRYVKAPSIPRVVVVGLAAGLALAAKHTGILVFPMFLLLALCELFREPSRANANAGTSKRAITRHAADLVLALVVIGAIAVAVLWSSYGFRYPARPAGLQLNPPLAEYVRNLSRPREIHLLQTVARFHLLPESYLYGLADVRIMSDFYQSFLLGKIYPHGVWFYFPLAFAIKSSLTFLILLALAVWAVCSRRFARWREILFLTIPPIFYLIIAMSSGMNIGVRHILPMYIFFSVLIGGVAAALINQDRRWVYAILVLLAYQAVSTARIYPSYMAYANELWGGPSETYKLLSDSNADWGQQLKDVKRYLDAHNIKDCWFIYFAEGPVDASYYGIPCRQLPTMDSMWLHEELQAPPEINGTVLISAGDLSGFEFGPSPLNPYEQFKSLKPKAVIDYSVFVYEGRFEIPLAAAISHTQEGQSLLETHQFDAALAETRQALDLAPDAAQPNALMGDILTVKGQPEEARTYYVRALTLARTIEPEFQIGLAKDMEGKLAAIH
ncbi:MAG TPA: glycosyltransferase family 39 protein [Candidatus Sulfotelmatobacter sp.]